MSRSQQHGVGALSGVPVLELIEQIRAKSLDPKLLRPADRRRCVQYLGTEGFLVEEMAQLFRVAERTIRRDRAAERKAAALRPDPELKGQLAGWLLQEAERAVQRIRRVTRDPACNPADRIAAERQCVELIDRQIARLQSLGLVDTAKLRAEVTTPEDDTLDLQAVTAELRRLAALEAIREEGQRDE